MQFIEAVTGADVRRWDTYSVPVPDDWDDEADDRDARLLDLIAKGKGQHQGTEYEDEHSPIPPGEFEIIEM